MLHPSRCIIVCGAFNACHSSTYHLQVMFSFPLLSRSSCLWSCTQYLFTCIWNSFTTITNRKVKFCCARFGTSIVEASQDNFVHYFVLLFSQELLWEIFGGSRRILSGRPQAVVYCHTRWTNGRKPTSRQFQVSVAPGRAQRKGTSVLCSENCISRLVASIIADFCFVSQRQQICYQNVARFVQSSETTSARKEISQTLEHHSRTSVHRW